MHDVLNRIFEIEEKAHHIVEDVRKEAAEVDMQISHIVKGMKGKIEERTFNKIEKIKQIEDIRLQADIAEEGDRYKENMERMENIYRNNKDKWILEMYHMIINGIKDDA